MLLGETKMEQALRANTSTGDGSFDVRRWIQIVQDFEVVS